jgi:hypothetical protein
MYTIDKLPDMPMPPGRSQNPFYNKVLDGQVWLLTPDDIKANAPDIDRLIGRLRTAAAKRGHYVTCVKTTINADREALAVQKRMTKGSLVNRKGAVQQ